MIRPLAIVNARLVDPASGLDRLGGLIAAHGRIVAVGDVSPEADTDVIDADGQVLCPGLLDAMSFRVDAAAAASGGISAIALMPDQSPPLDDSALVERAQRLGGRTLKVHPLAAATRALAGEELAELGLCADAGATACATGRGSIASAAVMLRVMQYAHGFGLAVISHCNDATLTEGACATEGEVATRLGLPAAPSLAETLLVERDLRLAEATGVRLHIAQATCADSLHLIRAAKRLGLPVTCGVTPAHFLLNDIAIGNYRTFARLDPPLRGEADRKAVVEALLDGTIDIISSGHDPRTDEDKRLPYAQAEPGMVGAETLLPLSLTLVHDHGMPLIDLLARLTVNPRRILGLAADGLTVGAPADLTLLDPDLAWRITAETLVSSAKNTPFDGLPVMGKATGCWVGGRSACA